MSIITDALKKAQDKRKERNADITSTLSPHFTASTTSTSANLKFGNKTYMIASLVLLLLLIPLAIILLNGGHTVSVDVTGTEPIKVAPHETPVATTPLPATPTQVTTPSAPAKETTPATLPVLNGIMYSPSLPQAIIDGALVTERETINGFTVEKIHADRVSISKNNENYELRLR